MNIFCIGIDSVEVARFAHWSTYHSSYLSRLFSSEEIVYCLAAVNPSLSAQRFATHFAMREAFFKALHHCPLKKPLPFLSSCKYVELAHEKSGAPTLIIDWISIEQYCHPNQLSLTSRVTITHTRDISTACVVLFS
jgi:phosphopantetheine--protein transferase-like protein